MTLYPTEESNLLVGNERNKKGWNTSVTIFSLGSHFAAGLLGTHVAVRKSCFPSQTDTLERAYS